MTPALPPPAVPGGRALRPVRARMAVSWGPARRTVTWARRAAGLPPMGVPPPAQTPEAPCYE